jgi:predicted nucleic acid-binding protein
VRELLIDNNGLDPFVDIPEAYEAALAAIERGDLKVWYVHTTLSEAAAVCNADRRTRLLLVLTDLGNRISTYGFLFNESRLDQAGFTDEAGTADLEGLASGHLDHPQNRRDALLANTAKINGWAILTNDKRLTKRAKERDVEVLTTDDLFGEIGFTPPADD